LFGLPAKKRKKRSKKSLFEQSNWIIEEEKFNSWKNYIVLLSKNSVFLFKKVY